MDDIIQRTIEALSPEALDRLKYMHSLLMPGSYEVRLYSPYYRDFVPHDVWFEAIDNIIPDEIDRGTLKPQVELIRNGLLDFVGSRGSVAEFRFTRLGWEVVKRLLETTDNTATGEPSESE